MKRDSTGQGRNEGDEMKLAVVAFPGLDEIDRQWIESFRAKHDPQASRIRAHFTLVFPFDGIPNELRPSLAAAAQSAEPIRFAIPRALVVADALAVGSHHIFLVPDEGSAQIATLHDRLYAGALRRHLRGDIRFVPHMTVGTTRDRAAAEKLAEALNAHARIVRGILEAVQLVDVGLPRVRSIASYALGDAGRAGR